MLKITKKIDASNFHTDELWDWLDGEYQADLYSKDSPKRQFDAMADYQHWGRSVLDNCPPGLEAAFFYLTAASHHYPVVNLRGRVNWGMI